MAPAGTIAAALAFVPEWWQETTDAAAVAELFARWRIACGYSGCGVSLPGSSGPVQLWVTDQAARSEAPPETPDALTRLQSGETCVVYPVAGGSSRYFAPVAVAGRGLGVVWAERPDTAWDEFQRSYLILTAQVLERAAALTPWLGPVPDPHRLQQRLSDAAIIAGRMAHDFDNILTGIIGFSDLTLPLLPGGSPAVNYVTEIAKVGQRGIQFTQQLHQLSRSGQVKGTPGSVALALSREENRLRPQIPAGLTIDKDIPPQLPMPAMDTALLQIVLGHILENAVEACPSGGRILCQARLQTISATEARSYLGRLAPGDHVVVTISDTGEGLKPEVRRRLFVEPFFTTKVRHRGLGLAIAYRILWVHHGGIRIGPAPHGGTQVAVALPLVPTPQTAEHSPAAARPLAASLTTHKH